MPLDQFKVGAGDVRAHAKFDYLRNEFRDASGYHGLLSLHIDPYGNPQIKVPVRSLGKRQLELLTKYYKHSQRNQYTDACTNGVMFIVTFYPKS